MREVGTVVFFPCPWDVQVIVGTASVVAEGPQWTALAKNVHSRLHGSGATVFFLPTDRLYPDKGAATAEAERMVRDGESVQPGTDTALIQRVVGRTHPLYKWRDVSEAMTGSRHE